MLRGFITAIRTLTAIPLPGKDADRLASSLPWFPVVGCLLGGILYAVAWVVGLIDSNHWPQGGALVVTVAGVFLTKGLHLDGLADFADGFGNWHEKAKTLAIMKDSHIGVFGAISIAVILLVKWVALTRLIASESTVYIVSGYVVSRLMLVELACSHPYARLEKGTGAPFIRDARPRDRIFAAIFGIVFLILLNGLIGIAIFIFGWISCRLIGLWSNKRIGGITGDVLGACSELVETMTFFLCALLGQGFSGWYGGHLW
jgi:adenosylcobinamide-GDP ribazoletransferase